MLQQEAGWYAIRKTEDLLTREFKHLLATHMKELGLSRLDSIEWLDQKLFHELDGPVVDGNGRPFNVHPDIIDEAYFGSDQYRWNTDMKRHADKLPKRGPNKTHLLRLKLWDLAFMIDGDPIAPVDSIKG